MEGGRGRVDAHTSVELPLPLQTQLAVAQAVLYASE